MELDIVEDYAELSDHAADLVAQTLRRNPASTLLMPTGNTALRMYSDLIRLCGAGGVSFSEARVFNLDEYVGLSGDDEASFARYMEENLFGLLEHRPRVVDHLDGEAEDPYEECERYERRLSSEGVDLCVLGIGENGHIAFNEPGARFSSLTRPITLAADTRRANADDIAGGVVPEQALTAGIATIMRSRRILLLASGAAKSRALARSLDHVPDESVPASALQLHADVTYVVDRDAAAELERASA